MPSDPNIIRYDNPDRLPAEWNMDSKGLEALKVVQAMNSTRGGLYANGPLICKGKNCPFLETCTVHAVGMDVDDLVGQRCAVEINDITRRFDGYCEYLGVEPDNLVDLGMIKELVDIEIMLERANKRMAQEGDFIEMIVVGVSENGDAIRRPEIRKSVDFKERMQRRKNDLLTLLNATRKDKAGSKLQI
ncbi:MAG: hypothetical protein NWF07_13700, partial [Candidatus Bathyarchaeota archaeon]|nr:hypothetical protein [Candidatus Bathyarchaeota archaeon]